jgi:hypothetical protein
MMKKVLSVLLTIALLLCNISVLAESEEKAEVIPGFDLIIVVPEGYESMGEEWTTPFLVSEALRPTEDDKPAIMVVVSYNDTFSDVTFNDEMPEADFEAQVNQLVIDEETGEALPYTVMKTGLGTKVIVINDPDGFTEFYSIWHGYEVSLMSANFDADNHATPPTDEQIAVIMQFLTDMDFQKVIEEKPAT